MTADSTATGTPYGTIPPASPLPQRKPISLPRLAQMRAAGDKITMLTAYDATFAAVADAAGVETILVGDSLGMVCQGLPSTVGVTLETMAYHTASVARGLRRAQGTAWVVADLPYGSYAENRASRPCAAPRALMQAGAHMVKLEGGGWTAPDGANFWWQRGIPVCAHLGLTPQTVHALGGYRVQGQGDAAAAARCASTRCELQDAGRGHAGAGDGARPALAAELTAGAGALPHHRHWRGQRHRRPGAGAARHAGHEPGQDAQVRAQLHAGRGQRARGAMAGLCAAPSRTAASPTTRCTPGKSRLTPLYFYSWYRFEIKLSGPSRLKPFIQPAVPAICFS